MSDWEDDPDFGPLTGPVQQKSEVYEATPPEGAPRGRNASSGTSRGGRGGGRSFGGSGRFPGGDRRDAPHDSDIWGQGAAGLESRGEGRGGGRRGGGGGYRGGRDDRGGGGGYRGGRDDRGGGGGYRGGRDDRDDHWGAGGGRDSYDSRRGEGFSHHRSNYTRDFAEMNLESNGFSGGSHGDRRGGMDRPGRDDDRPRESYSPEEGPTEDLFAYGISSGINFEKYDNIKCQLSGENSVAPMADFESSGLRKLLLDNIRRSGYLKPTPVQKYAVPIIKGNRDLMACAQTGSGKTAAFILPILHKLMADEFGNHAGEDTQKPEAVIIAPTRELAIQIKDEARKFAAGSGIKSVVIYGGTSVGHQMKLLRGGCNILVATPGRLLHFVEAGKVSFQNLKILVLDEADRMLDEGFMKDVDVMVQDASMPSKGDRQTVMFSATFPMEIQEAAKMHYLHDYLFLTVGIVGGACADVRQSVFKVDQYDKRNKLVEILKDTDIDKTKTLIFVEQKKNADFLASFLCQNDFPTTSIHGNRLQREREEALKDFRTDNKPVLVATAVAARGLDIKDVSHVINYDLPKSIDEYVHRIGRTGRVGNTGQATSFYDPSQDGPLARDLLKVLTDAEQEVPLFLQADAKKSFNAAGGGFNAMGFGGRDIRERRKHQGNNHQEQPSESPMENSGMEEPPEDWD